MANKLHFNYVPTISSFSNLRTNVIAPRIGRILQARNNINFQDELSDLELTYNSHDIAFSIIKEYLTVDDLRALKEEHEGSTDSELFYFVLNFMKDYFANSDDSIERFQNFKKQFVHFVAFGLKTHNRNFFTYLSWSDRNRVSNSNLTISFERSSGLEQFIKNNYSFILIKDISYIDLDADTIPVFAYDQDYFIKYSLGDLEVYSKIPAVIANSFSYCLQVDSVSLYDHDSSISIEDNRTNNTLICGKNGDVVFQDYHKEAYLEAMDSSEKIEASYLKSPFRANIALEKSVVRKRTLKKGYSIIPIIDKLELVDPATFEITKVNFLRIRINAKRNSFMKYSSSLKFIKELPGKFFSHEGLAWIDPDLYKQKLSKMLGSISKHNPAFVEEIISSNCLVDKLKVPKPEYLSSFIKPKDFRYHEVNSLSLEIPQLEDLAKTEQAYISLAKKNDDWKLDLSNKKDLIRGSEQRCTRYTSNIEYYENHLRKEKEALQAEKEENEKRLAQITSLEANIQGIAETLSTLKDEVQKAKTIKLEKVISSADSIDVTWLDNVKSSNVLINSCYYTLPLLWEYTEVQQYLSVSSTCGPRLIPSLVYESEGCTYFINIKDCPQLAYYAQEKIPIPLELIFGEKANYVAENWDIDELYLVPQLAEILFDTITPSIISVDGSSVNQVVGGPYSVRLSAGVSHYTGDKKFGFSPRLTIKLKDETSVFGFCKQNHDSLRYNFWVHPHTNYSVFDINKQFIESATNYIGNACLGDASPSLYKAFQQSNVRSAIFIAKAWIESANSSDTWGKHYKNFPKVSEVILDNTVLQDNKNSESQEISEVELTEMLQDLMDQAAGEETLDEVTQPGITVQTVNVTQTEDAPAPDTAPMQATEEAVQPTQPAAPTYTTYAEVVAG